jgi:hypothetical protein
MPDWSRRRALHALATGTAVTLAGCSSESGFTAEPEPGWSRRTQITNYTSRTVRDPAGNPLFWRGERLEDPNRARRGRIYVTSTEDLSELTFAPESEASAELNAFVRSTDFEASSVSLHSRIIPDCETVRLLSVGRESEGYYASFCSEPRPADTECDAEAEVTVAIAIRLPFPGDNISSSGASWSHRCRERPYPVTPSNESEGSNNA